MAFGADETNDMMSNIAESMWRQPHWIAVFAGLSLWSVQGLSFSAPAYAHESEAHPVSAASSGATHSLLRPVRSVDPTSSDVKEEGAPVLNSESGQKPFKRKKAKVVDKNPVTVPQRASAMASTVPAQTTGEAIEQERSGGMKPAGFFSSGSAAMAGTSMTGMGTTSTIMAAAASSPQAALAAVAPSALLSSVVGGPSTPSNKNIQRLSAGIPGLTRIIATPLPPETIAMPAPPLDPPASGLPAAPANWFGYHVLSRLSFGGTPNQLNAVSHMTAAQARDWATRYMKEQLGLDPAQPWPTNLHSTSSLPIATPIVDTDTDLRLMTAQGRWKKDDLEPTVLKPDLHQVQDHDLIRKLYSRRQLLEKMAYFWDNHFNTDFRSHFRGQYEVYENEAFRALAYGRFVDLLIASGKSPAMMVYLNTDVSKKENPNENYAREVLELHTLGVDEHGHPAGYTQTDINEAAKAFTGWTVPAGSAPGFRFVAWRHSPGAKTVLGQPVAFDGSGPTEGERVLQIAASHPSTARHLAKKLCEYFVSETPSSALVTEVASVFSDSGGDIRKVLIAIVTSSDFNNVANYRSLVKTPLEYAVGLYRNLGVWSSHDPIRRRLTAAGQGLFEMPPPTGYKENSEHWLNTYVLFHETAMAYEATMSGFGSTIRFGSDTSGGLIRLWLKGLGLRTEAEVLGFLLNLTNDRVATATEYQIYLTTLRSGGGTFNLDNPSTEAALDRTLASMLANPRYLYQ
ncbi:MAG: hypothetical protein LZF86_250033 [Nitrospira sp.]|nr:MAG: hypothetical protein LZF86_250033 [Nitrospira sp.]